MLASFFLSFLPLLIEEEKELTCNCICMIEISETNRDFAEKLRVTEENLAGNVYDAREILPLPT